MSERMGHVELADPEDMAAELEEVTRVTRGALDRAFEEGYEDGAFTAERWPLGKLRDAYVEGWNLGNPDDIR